MTTPDRIHVLPQEAMPLWQPPRLRAIAKYQPGTGMPESIEIEVNDQVTPDLVQHLVATLISGEATASPTKVVVEHVQPGTSSALTYDPSEHLRRQQDRLQVHPRGQM